MKAKFKVEVEPPRPGICYSYCRVSTERQAKHGMSLEQQEKTIEAYYKFKLEPQGYQFGGVYRDPATSGKVPLLQRKSGFELSLKLEAGDCVCFAKLDRGFRSLKDMIETIDVWQARGVSVHMLDINVETGTDIGRLILNILGAVSQFERERISERIREAYAVRREKGAHMGYAPRGFKMQKDHHGKIKLVRDEYQRRLMALVVEYREKGWSFDAIYFDFLKKKIRKKNGKEIDRSGIHLMYHEEMKLRAREEEEAKKQAEKGAT